MNVETKKRGFIILYIFIGLLGRLIPHPANFTPIDNLCLFSGKKLNHGVAISTMLICLILSDFILSLLHGYPMFGAWSLFTYSAYIVMILAGYRLKNKSSIKALFIYTVSAAFGFWVWTNFGSWLFGFSSTIYPKNLMGLLSCYTVALPFLRNAILGNLVWMVIIFSLYHKIEKSIFVKQAALRTNTSIN